MSWEATNWVLKQRSRNSATQCLLLVIANASDPDGVAFGWWKSRDHWWPYLMERTRLSRGALFRLMGELEDKGYFTRGEVKPDGGGRPQPVIHLHLERVILEPETADSESTAATELPARTPPEMASESTPETQNQSQPKTDEMAPVTPQRLPESTLATTRDVPVLNPITPQSPPLAKPRGGEEPNGFALFWSEYPDHQAMNRKRALEAFNELAESDQQQAVKTVSFYARDIAKLKRRPVSPANWLTERRFTEYGVGRQTSASTTATQLVKEGTEPWKAWCAVAAVAFGGKLQIPYFWGSQQQRGALRPSQWPLGGEAWLVPFDQWIFIERGTAQHGRWCERIREMMSRDPVPINRLRVRPAREIRASESSDPQGLLVPLEWPPPKGTGQQKTTCAA